MLAKIVYLLKNQSESRIAKGSLNNGYKKIMICTYKEAIHFIKIISVQENH